MFACQRTPPTACLCSPAGYSRRTREPRPVKVPGDDSFRLKAAEAAVAEVKPGMKLGLGSGRTAEHFVRFLGEKVRAGLKIVGVPTSERTAELARELGIPLATLDEVPALDLDVDGADEIDPELRLIKGGGGALL